jgi:hypothetical protein
MQNIIKLNESIRQVKDRITRLEEDYMVALTSSYAETFGLDFSEPKYIRHFVWWIFKQVRSDFCDGWTMDDDTVFPCVHPKDKTVSEDDLEFLRKLLFDYHDRGFRLGTRTEIESYENDLLIDLLVEFDRRNEEMVHFMIKDYQRFYHLDILDEESTSHFCNWLKETMEDTRRMRNEHFEGEMTKETINAE